MTFTCDLDNLEQDYVFSDMEYFENSNFLIKMEYCGMQITFNSGISAISSNEIKNFLYKLENNFGLTSISFNSYNGSKLCCDSNGKLYLQVYTCKECCFTSLNVNIRLDQQSFDNFINIIKKLLNFSEKYENLKLEDDEEENEEENEDEFDNEENPEEENHEE